MSRGVYESDPGSRGIDRDADIAVAVAFRRCAIASVPLRSVSVAADVEGRDEWRDALVFGLPRATLELAHAEYSCSLRMLEVAMQADGRRRATTTATPMYLVEWCIPSRPLSQLRHRDEERRVSAGSRLPAVFFGCIRKAAATPHGCIRKAVATAVFAKGGF